MVVISTLAQQNFFCDFAKMWTVCRCVSNRCKSQFHWNVSLIHHFSKKSMKQKQLDFVDFKKRGFLTLHILKFICKKYFILIIFCKNSFSSSKYSIYHKYVHTTLGWPKTIKRLPKYVRLSNFAHF